MRGIYILCVVAFAFFASAHAEDEWRPKSSTPGVSIDRLFWQATEVFEESILGEDGEVLTTRKRKGEVADIAHGRFLDIDSITLSGESPDEYWVVRYREEISSHIQSVDAEPETELKEIKTKNLHFPSDAKTRGSKSDMPALPKNKSRLVPALAIMGYEIVKQDQNESKKNKATLQDQDGKEFRLEPLNKKSQLSIACLLYTSPSPRDQRGSRMPSSA